MNRFLMDVVMQSELAGSVPHILDQHGNEIPCRENELRILRMADGLRRLPDVRFMTPDIADSQLDRLLAEVHDPVYLAYLAESSRTLLKGETVMYHPHIPEGVDADTPIVQGIYDVARDAARSAIQAAIRTAEGTRFTYALCRPPGHHAGPSWLGGHCYLNNGVVALRALRQAGLKRLALIDFDFHFGNGTADILAHDPDIFFGSIHSSTLISYPYKPTTEPHHRQLYIPFTDDPGPERFLEGLSLLLEHALRTRPEAIVVSVGYDIIAGDPFGKWDLHVELLEEIGSMLAEVSIPLCMVQEGGYLPEHLDECTLRFGLGLLRGARRRPFLEEHRRPAMEKAGLAT